MRNFSRFPSRPLMTVPLFLLLGVFNKETHKEKGQQGSTGAPVLAADIPAEARGKGLRFRVPQYGK